jgi:polyisoprenoid-binding protein YceI
MRKTLVIGIAAALLIGKSVTTGSAQPTASPSLSLAKESRLWFDGTSTVKSFSCSATKLHADVTAEPQGDPASMVKTATLNVPVAGLDCRNGTMNGHMQKALKVQANPLIIWRMTSYKVEGNAVVIDGFLTIAGQENPIQLRGTGSADNGVLRVKGSKQLRMTEYGVKPPKLMLGAMKVADQVTVGYDIMLGQ